ncbi:MAG: hypothetical protein EOP39_25715, partial [Rubrivivax sp.]
MPTRTAREFNGVPPEVQSRLEGAGLRRTLATRAVLGLFLGRPRSRLTHAQAQGALAARGLDLHRVTLYRLLDRLAACGVLQREADEQRNWRFSLALENGHRVSHVGPSFDVCEAETPVALLVGLALQHTAGGQPVEQAVERHA